MAKEKKKKKYITTRDGKPVVLPSRKKWNTVTIYGSAAAAILLFLTAFIPDPEFLGLPMFSIFPIIVFVLAVISRNDERDVRVWNLINPLERFAQYQISPGDTNDIPRERSTVINTVMDCRHDYDPTDEKGNCLACKEEFTLAVTSEVREYLDEALSEAVEIAEENHKKKVYREKERELNLKSTHSQHLVSLFEDNDKIASLKKSKYTVNTLEELTEEDVRSYASRELSNEIEGGR